MMKVGILALVLSLQSPPSPIGPIGEADATAHASSPRGGDDDPWTSLEVMLATTDRGRRLRGDWEPADVVVVTFSVDLTPSVAEISGAVAAEAPVLGLAPDNQPEEELTRMLRQRHVPADRIELVPAVVDSAWIRDYGPLQITDRDGNRIWLDSDYSWRRNDDVVPALLARLFSMRLENIPEPLEGGSIISNGQGLCVSTRDFFTLTGLTLDDDAAAQSFLQQIGCLALALVPALADEPTRHADMFAQFFAPTTLALASFDPELDPRDAFLMDEAERIIRSAAAAIGMTLTVHRIPHEPPEDETYYSYINGLRVRSRFLAPSYAAVSPDAEAAALEALQQALPEGVTVEPVTADTPLTLNGAVHCLALGLTLPRRIARVADVAVVSRPRGRHLLTMNASAAAKTDRLAPLVSRRTTAKPRRRSL